VKVMSVLHLVKISETEYHVWLDETDDVIGKGVQLGVGKTITAAFKDACDECGELLALTADCRMGLVTIPVHDAHGQIVASA
jgi:hypothetical protein